MSYNRDDIVAFLEQCVFKTLTRERYPEQFQTIINALRERYKDSNKFSDQTLDKITAIKVDRDTNKSLQVCAQYNGAKKWNRLKWTNMYSKSSCLIPTLHSRVCNAFRTAIKNQTVMFLNSYHGNPKCDKCGILGIEAKIEVDHLKPKTFSWILNAFLEQKGITENDVKVGWNGWNYIISNQKLCDEWQTFHGQHSTFRLLCSKCNKEEW